MARKLPQAPRSMPQEHKEWANQLTGLIERSFADAERPVSIGWHVSNVTSTKTFDPTTATLQQVADVLATLLADLKRGGGLG